VGTIGPNYLVDETTVPMHASDLAQLAGLVAFHGPAFLRDSERLTAVRLESYWSASRCRLERWLQQLRLSQTEAPPEWARGGSHSLRSVLEEILLSELLTRVWTCLVVEHDRRHNCDDAGNVARSIHLGHQEARNRTLQLMLRGPGVATEEAVGLNRLRRRVERWTDMLLGFLLLSGVKNEWAFDPQRALDFSIDMKEDYSLRREGQTWPLLFASLQSAFSEKLAPTAACPELNEKIAGAILGCFGPSLFDTAGLAHSLWMVRLTGMTSDTEGLIQELILLETAPQLPTKPPLPIWPGKRRF